MDLLVDVYICNEEKNCRLMVFILDVYSGVSLWLIVDFCYLCLSFVLINITLNTFPVEYSIHFFVVLKANDNIINNNNFYNYTGTGC